MAKKHVVRVLRFLVEQRNIGAQYLWYGLVAKRLRMHHEVVRRIVEGYLSGAVEFVDVDPLLQLGLRIRPFRVKEDVSVEGYMKYLKTMKKI